MRTIPLPVMTGQRILSPSAPDLSTLLVPGPLVCPPEETPAPVALILRLDPEDGHVISTEVLIQSRKGMQDCAGTSLPASRIGGSLGDRICRALVALALEPGFDHGFTSTLQTAVDAMPTKDGPVQAVLTDGALLLSPHTIDDMEGAIMAAAWGAPEVVGAAFDKTHLLVVEAERAGHRGLARQESLFLLLEHEAAIVNSNAAQMIPPDADPACRAPVQIRLSAPAVGLH